VALPAGTAPYLAPEQLAGGEVTARSDIYALGLVLYEIFTGQRAIDAKTIAELIRRREQSGGILAPSAIVRDMDPQVERVIMRCLAPAPENRPASALAVSASLPGGDPLAAALAAGETPSPEMVAAAGGVEWMSRRKALSIGCAIALAIVAILVLYQHVMMLNRVPTPKTPDALQDRAVEARSKLGYAGTPAATAWGLGFSLDYAAFVERTSTAGDRWKTLAAQRPEGLYLWYRTSPRALIPFGSENPVAGQNPPMNVAGMTLTAVDASGRLAEFLAVPEPFEESGSHAPTDWKAAFDAAGIDMPAFKAVAPRVVPPVYADERIAWEGPLPELPDHTFRIEGAGYAGKPVYFVVGGQWSRSSRGSAPSRSLFYTVINESAGFVMPALMLVGALLARRNVKLGRGDRRGAFRAATALFLAKMAVWVLSTHVMPVGEDVQRGFAAVAHGLFDAALLWLTYLGLEPYVRRHAPDRLIGWTRLIAARWRDPRVGADVAIGVLAGLAMTALYALHNVIPPLIGLPEPMPLTTDVSVLLGTRHVLAEIIARVADAVQSSMLGMVGIVALIMWLRRPWLATLVGIICFTPVALGGMFSEGTPILDIVIGAGIITVFVLMLGRFGLLALPAAAGAADAESVVLVCPPGPAVHGHDRRRGIWRALHREARKPRRHARDRRSVRKAALKGCTRRPRSLFPAPDLQPDRRPDEAERLAKLVDQEPFVREMEIRRDVGEQHERRRRHSLLRRVKNAHVLPARARRRMRGGDGLDEPVQLSRGNPLRARLGDLVDHLEHFGCALAGRRRDVQDGGVLQELHLLAQLVVERLREIGAAPLHQVPLVGGDDDAAAGLLGLAGDRRVLIGGPFGRVDEQHRHVRLADGAPREDDAQRLELAAAGHAPRASDAGCVHDPERAMVPLQHRIDRVPRGPRRLADEGALLVE
jgi:serine/threonine-protein kinase